MIDATINGETRSLAKPVTISQFLKEIGIDERVVVVEYNGEILMRGRYGAQMIMGGDVLEIVQMMAGGS